MSDPFKRYLDGFDQEEARIKSETTEKIAASLDARSSLVALLSEFLKRMKAMGDPPQAMDILEKRSMGRSVRAYRVSWYCSQQQLGEAIWIRPGEEVWTYRNGKFRWEPLSSLVIFGVNGQRVLPKEDRVGIRSKGDLSQHLAAATEAMARIMRRAQESRHL